MFLVSDLSESLEHVPDLRLVTPLMTFTWSKLLISLIGPGDYHQSLDFPPTVS